MTSFVLQLSVGMGSKRSGFLIATSAAMIAASARARSSSVITFSMPVAPWVSILASQPAASIALVRDSAAMNVCAMPIMHAVTPTMYFFSAIYPPLDLLRSLP